MHVNLPPLPRPKVAGFGVVGKTYACRRCGAKAFLPRPTAGPYPETIDCGACACVTPEKKES